MPRRFASSICGAMPVSAVSAGEVLQNELAAAACFRRLLLLQHAPGAAVARGYTHAPHMMYPSVSPARGNVVSNGQEVWSTPLSGQAWPIQSVRRVTGQQNTAVESHHSYHNMLRKYDEVAYIYENLLRLCDQPLVTGE